MSLLLEDYTQISFNFLRIETRFKKNDINFSFLLTKNLIYINCETGYLKEAFQKEDSIRQLDFEVISYDVWNLWETLLYQDNCYCIFYDVYYAIFASLRRFQFFFIGSDSYAFSRSEICLTVKISPRSFCSKPISVWYSDSNNSSQEFHVRVDGAFVSQTKGV